jgi:two-component sensor histidine kinase
MAQLDAGGLPLNCEIISLSDLISDTLESFSELATRQDITLTGSVATNVGPVFMDAQLIGRVLNNLISNSLRHTQPGGIVEVTTVTKGFHQMTFPWSLSVSIVAKNPAAGPREDPVSGLPSRKGLSKRTEARLAWKACQTRRAFISRFLNKGIKRRLLF